ncbi:MAG: phage head closure protein [Planctomycetota bacterium]|jgi:SPP1 family predicted phage head-tail adaptor
MRAGRLRDTVTIEEGTRTRTAGGGTETTWAVLCRRKASVQTLRGEEFVAAQQVEGSLTHRVIMRKYTVLTQRHRLRFKTRILGIASIAPLDAAHCDYEVMCREET